jgi:hypothetical protein
VKLRAESDGLRGRVLCLVSAATVALLGGACTFYTSCPTDNGAADQNDAGKAGSSSTAGSSSMGGSNNGGGSSNDGGMDMGPDPTGEFVDATGNLVEMATDAMDLSLLTSVAGSERIIVGMGMSGVWASDDAGATWSQLGSGDGSDTVNSRPTHITFDPERADVFWLSGIYGSGAFRTDDAGTTFKWLGGLSYSDLLSVDFTDPDRQLMVAGGHEMSNLLWLSTNGGESWTDIGDRLPDNSGFATLPLVIDSKNILVGSCGGGAGTCGVFRSDDAGDTWSVVSDKGPYQAPLWASDGTIYWSLDGGGMIVSEDEGKTWSETSPGPAKPYSDALVELPDGRILTLGRDFPLVTSDRGKSWTKVGGKLPFRAENCGTYGLTYSVALKTLFVNHNDCTGHLSEDALWSLPFDWETD